MRGETKTAPSVDPYTLLLTLSGKKPPESLPDPYRTIVRLLKDGGKFLKQLPGFRELVRDGILSVKIEVKVGI